MNSVKNVMTSWSFSLSEFNKCFWSKKSTLIYTTIWTYTLERNMLTGLFQINCALPPLHKGCQCILCKKFGTSLAILLLFLKIPAEKMKRQDFGCLCGFYSGNLWKQGFLSKKKLENQGLYFTKKSGNSTSSIPPRRVGEGTLFLE